jgi:hypothetical protein
MQAQGRHAERRERIVWTGLLLIPPYPPPLSLLPVALSSLLPVPNQDVRPRLQQCLDAGFQDAGALTAGVLAARGQKEVLDLLDLLGLKKRQCGNTQSANVVSRQHEREFAGASRILLHTCAH